MTGMEIVAPSVQRISTTLPSFLFALGILVVGYVVAKIVAGVVGRALGRTHLDARTAEALGLTEPGAAAAVRSVAARIAFWLIMLFVLIGFFNKLGLTLVAEPLTHVADTIARVAPSLLHAGLIFVVAWILAGLLRWLVVKTLTRFDVERRFGHFFVPEGTDPRGLAQTMGTLTFYLVLLLAIPPFLAALGQSAVVAPLSEMLRILLSYLPNVAAAAVSIGLGWVVARILRQLASNLLAGVGLDRAAERAGIAPAPGGVRPSALVATIVYFVVWIPFIIAGLDALKIEAISRPAINALDTLLAWVPRGLGGAVLLILAWVVSRLVGDLVTQLLRGVGFDAVPARLGLVALRAGRKDALRARGGDSQDARPGLCRRRDLRGDRASPTRRLRGPSGGLHDQRRDCDGHCRCRTLGGEPRAGARPGTARAVQALVIPRQSPPSRNMPWWSLPSPWRSSRSVSERPSWCGPLSCSSGQSAWPWPSRSAWALARRRLAPSRAPSERAGRGRGPGLREHEPTRGAGTCGGPRSRPRQRRPGARDDQSAFPAPTLTN